jgi:CheY-like chemotaxis protein
MRNMLRRMLGDKIRLSISHESAVSAIEADSGQIEQLLMNLAVNARDAMAGSGELFISTETVARDSEKVGDGAARARRYAVLTVRDTGPGMDADTQGRVFEPFFTTKDPSKGTGLGLSTVYGIVKQSGGFIEVDSVPGSGTAFRTYFPAADALPAIAVPVALPERRRHGSECILLVEDEAALLALVGSTLRAHGYRVVEADGGRAALALAEEPHRRIDLLVTDVILPDLSGPEVAEQLLAAQPGIKVLYLSGYTDDYVGDQALRGDRTHLLEKPFTIGALLSQVRAALDGTHE